MIYDYVLLIIFVTWQFTLFTSLVSFRLLHIRAQEVCLLIVQPVYRANAMIHVSLSSSSSSFEKLFRQPKKACNYKWWCDWNSPRVRWLFEIYCFDSIRFNSMESAFEWTGEHLFCFGLVSDGIGFSYPWEKHKLAVLLLLNSWEKKRNDLTLTSNRTCTMARRHMHIVSVRWIIRKGVYWLNTIRSLFSLHACKSNAVNLRILLEIQLL